MNVLIIFPRKYKVPATRGQGTRHRTLTGASGFWAHLFGSPYPAGRLLGSAFPLTRSRVKITMYNLYAEMLK